MAAVVTLTVSTATQFALDAARDAFSALKRGKGLRPQAVVALLDAKTAEDRDDAIATWGAGFVRRGLREAAVFYDRKGDHEVANAFWTLRDSVDEDGFLDDTESVEDDES